MSDEKISDPADEDEITYTQIGCCAPGGYNSEPVRISLRARLEAEQEERRQNRKAGIANGIKKLFG